MPTPGAVMAATWVAALGRGRRCRGEDGLCGVTVYRRRGCERHPRMVAGWWFGGSKIWSGPLDDASGSLGGLLACVFALVGLYRVIGVGWGQETEG